MNTKTLAATPSQTIGPFFAYSLTAAQYGYTFNSIVNGSLIKNSDDEKQICIYGNVFDGDGNAVHDAMIELWHADANGCYPSQISNPNLENTFFGFGRLGTGTEADKRFTFKTIKPGSVNGSVPYINVLLFMRGSLHTLYTRIYFDDEENTNDPLLQTVSADRQKTVIAKRQIKQGKIFYEFNIYMQGESETVFFDVYK